MHPTVILSYTHCFELTLRYISYLSPVYRDTIRLLDYSSCYTPPLLYCPCSCLFYTSGRFTLTAAFFFFKPHLRIHLFFASYMFCSPFLLFYSISWIDKTTIFLSGCLNDSGKAIEYGNTLSVSQQTFLLSEWEKLKIISTTLLNFPELKKLWAVHRELPRLWMT